jgi:hypothetical protein
MYYHGDKDSTSLAVSVRQAKSRPGTGHIDPKRTFANI